MAEAKLDFSSNSAEAERNIAKLTKENAKLRESIRQTNETSKRGAADAMKANNSLANSIGVAATKLTSLGAIGASVYSTLTRRADELAQRHKNLLPMITKPLAESGTLEQAPATQQWLTQLAKSGVTKEHALQALEGSSLGGELTPERQREIASQAAPWGQTGMDTKRFSSLMAEIDKGSGGVMSPDDLQDTALMAKRLLGDKADQLGGDRWQKQLTRLRESGMEGKAAIDVAIGALSRDERGNSLELIDRKLQGDRLSRDDKKEYERLFDPAEREKLSKQMEDARRTNFASRQFEFVPGGNRSENALGVLRDEATTRRGATETARKNVTDAYTEGLDTRTDVSASVQRMFDPIYRTLDNILVAVGLESAEGQAKSLARAGVASGTFKGEQANALLAELKTQTRIMAEEKTRRPVVEDAKERP
jgi:hypothetical protein